MPTSPTPSQNTTIIFRRVHSIDVCKFESYILESALFKNLPDTLPELVELYNNTQSNLLDKHAPPLSKHVKFGTSYPWFTPQLANLKHERRKLERSWKRTHTKSAFDNLRAATKSYHRAIVHAMQSHYHNLIDSSSSNPRRLWSVINSVLHHTTNTQFPSDILSSQFSDSFATFFSNKITTLHSALISVLPSTPPQPQPTTKPNLMDCFQPLSLDEWILER